MSSRHKESSFDFVFPGPHLTEHCLANEVLQKRKSWDGITDILKEQRNIFSTSTVTHAFYHFDKMTRSVWKWHLPPHLQYLTKSSDFIHKSSTQEEQPDTSSVFLCFQSALGVAATGARSGTCRLSSQPYCKKRAGTTSPPAPTQACCFLTILFSPNFKIIWRPIGSRQLFLYINF